MLVNQVPKRWHEKDIYTRLIRNDDEGVEIYDMISRGGSFEVSTVTQKGDLT